MQSNLVKSLSIDTDNGNYQNNRIAWGAIVAGVIVSLGYETLFNFLGIGLGLASLNPKNPTPFNLETGAIIWLTLSGAVSMGIGGWFVGKFSNISCAFTRGYHGVIAWALAIVLTIAISTSAAGAFMGGAINVMSNVNRESVSQKTETNVSNEQQAPTQSVNQSEPDVQTGVYIGNIGKISIFIFIAFFLSILASIMGSIYGGYNRNSEII